MEKIQRAIAKAFLSVGSFATQDVITNILSQDQTLVLRSETSDKLDQTKLNYRLNQTKTNQNNEKVSTFHFHDCSRGAARDIV